MASLPMDVPASLANLASLCIGDFFASMIDSLAPPLRSFPGLAMSIVMSAAATDNEHFFPVEPKSILKRIDEELLAIANYIKILQ